MTNESQPRSLESTLFNLAHAYALAADASRKNGASTGNADLAAPAIMCQSFAIELLLKFFLAIDHPAATTTNELKNAGVKLNCHKYSQLFDQLLPATKEKIAKSFTALSGKKTDTDGFLEALIAQGDEPFVHWRYIYETNDFSHLDLQAFHLITDSLGKAAEAERKASSNRR
jgi:hypothetical protein